MSGHVVLLGDSIFDNAVYVPGMPPVIEQLRASLPAGWQATLCAVDGATTEDIAAQLQRVPTDATHLLVSVGGNDALGAASVLFEPAAMVGEALQSLHRVQLQFQQRYMAMLETVCRRQLRTAICTIYDAVPGLGGAEITALAAFNDTILRAAIRRALPVIDLRIVCTEPDDYSALSPIEPSAIGGAKIANTIARLLATDDRGAHTVIFA